MRETKIKLGVDDVIDFVKAARMISEKIVDMKPFISEVYELEDYQKAFESAVKGDKFRVVIRF